MLVLMRLRVLVLWASTFPFLFRRRRFLLLFVLLHDLVHAAQNVLCADALAPGANGKQAGLGGDAVPFGVRVRAVMGPRRPRRPNGSSGGDSQ
jgi:hypothetical protein